MIGPAEAARLNPGQRTEIIYSAARREIEGRLWRSALGEAGERKASPDATAVTPGPDLSELVRSLLAQPAPPAVRTVEPSASAEVGGALALGPNQRHAASIAAAAERTGIPAPALAAIVDAESAKRRDGSWNPMGRNPRSSAAGLGQFLSGTWVGEAERRGTWLSHVAAGRGWLDGRGKVRSEARAELLALRYDPTASIQATADYARRNLDRLERAGARVGNSVGDVARTAYLAHHLGAGDAVRFLRGGLEPGRAARLLAAQIGTERAAQRIAAAGDAAAAHRGWLLRYVDRSVRPAAFTV